jgi:hypothetical protein
MASCSSTGDHLEVKNLELHKLYFRSLVCVNSKDRDSKTDTTPSKYRIKIPSMNNIKNIKLISTIIPNTEYTINQYNNIVEFIDPDPNGVPNTGGRGNGLLTAILQEGNYDADSFAAEIQRAMNSALGNDDFSVVYRYADSRLVFTRIAPSALSTFVLAFGSGTHPQENVPRRIMGFYDNIDTDTNQNTVIHSDKPIDLSGATHVNLIIKNLQDASIIENTSYVNNMFARIKLTSSAGSSNYDTFDTTALLFQTPLHGLGHLDVEFRKDDGALYDFNDFDHSFVLEFICEKK